MSAGQNCKCKYISETKEEFVRGIKHKKNVPKHTYSKDYYLL
jgi:hypothetical protein